MALTKQTYFLTNYEECAGVIEDASKVEATSHSEAASEYLRLHHADFDYTSEETFWVWLLNRPVRRVRVQAEMTYNFIGEELE